jgi:hypothetical protein
MDDVDQLLRSAQERTGLSDFGDDSFREGLERLVRSLRTEAKLNAVGDVALPELIGKHLSQRLQIESWYARHPEIDEVPITAPLIGLGLPRTGSTALSILLAEDPDARSLRRWEASAPCPPPSTVRGPDPRIAQAEAEQALADEMAPRLGALVPTSATGPEECQDLMALDFRSHYFQAFAYVPSYSDWLLDADLGSTYHYERRALKLLQWGEPFRPWRLKCPSHLLWLEYLDDAFPDARFVMTHRDPAEVMVSVADVYAEVGRQFSEDVDPVYLGDLNVRHWTAAMNRVVEFRHDHGDDRFFDMDFRTFQRDPIAQVHALYSWLGEPVSSRFEQGMREWWAQHAADRVPNVHPDPSEFGLDVDELQGEFAPYTERMREWIGRTSGGPDTPRRDGPGLDDRR